MQHKKIIAALMFLGLLTLTACGGKKIDDADVVSFDYKYTFNDGTIIEQGSKNITIGNTNNNAWIESLIIGAKEGKELEGTVNGNEVYKSEYNASKVQAYPNIILTEVMGISDPKIGTKVKVDNVGEGIITNIEKDSDGYDSYVINFNEPKTYSDLLYYIKITNVEKF